MTAQKNISSTNPVLLLSYDINPAGAGRAVVFSGTLSPDATGNYTMTGLYNKTHYFKRADGAYFIWFDPVLERWYCSAALGNISGPYWKHEGYRWLISLWTAGGGASGGAALTGNWNCPIDSAFDIDGGYSRVRLDLTDNLNQAILPNPLNFGVVIGQNLYRPHHVAFDGTKGLFLCFSEVFGINDYDAIYNGLDPNYVSTTGKLVSQFYGWRYWL